MQFVRKLSGFVSPSKANEPPNVSRPLASLGCKGYPTSVLRSTTLSMPDAAS